MLFILSAAGVPSSPACPHRLCGDRRPSHYDRCQYHEDSFGNGSGRPAPSGTRVVVGLTSRCPYGLAACWGELESLKRLPAVASVSQEANAAESTAELF